VKEDELDSDNGEAIVTTHFGCGLCLLKLAGVLSLLLDCSLIRLVELGLEILSQNANNESIGETSNDTSHMQDPP
jgi:hypothetical protein